MLRCNQARVRLDGGNSSPFEIIYNGASADLGTVSLAYWIGTERFADDEYVDLGFEVKREDVELAVTATQNLYAKDTSLNALD